MQRTERGGGGDQWLFEKIKVFLTNQKHEPNIVEITHLCIMHGAHTSDVFKSTTAHSPDQHWRERSGKYSHQRNPNSMKKKGCKPNLRPSQHG
jgi:hypothetical protein